MTPTLHVPTEKHGIIAVSSPGMGLARQYRVQYQLTKSEPDWRMYGSYTRLEQATACVKNLQDLGCRARMVRHSICPAA